MTQRIQSIIDLAPQYDAIVVDQWGVLHNGSTAYPEAISAIERLSKIPTPLAVLSNSGKRAHENRDRISHMGFDPAMFKQVMTSGEALWQDIKSSQITETSFYVIERANGDAQSWAEGLDITLTSIECAEAVLLMGLADDADKESLQPVMDLALESELPVYCSNPDRISPRAEGLVMSPGALAHTHQERGGRVVFYGKPHRAVFDALQTELSAERLLMVGDSLEHDICGAHAAGWDSVFVTEGIYAREFANAPFDETLSRLAKAKCSALPTYSIGYLA